MKYVLPSRPQYLLITYFIGPPRYCLCQEPSSSDTSSPYPPLHVHILARPLTSTHHIADATLFFIGTQLETILRFFLRRNIAVARERAYAQTVASRGKGADFWGSYVEEWPNPPKVTAHNSKGWSIQRLLSTFAGRMILKNGKCMFRSLRQRRSHITQFSSLRSSPCPSSALSPLRGCADSALRGTCTLRYVPCLHASRLPDARVLVFCREAYDAQPGRRLRRGAQVGVPRYASTSILVDRSEARTAFGFTASLLEGLPIIGLVFTVSNRIGAAMWAHGPFITRVSHYHGHLTHI
jgi:hypothetical protein